MAVKYDKILGKMRESDESDSRAADSAAQAAASALLAEQSAQAAQWACNTASLSSCLYMSVKYDGVYRSFKWADPEDVTVNGSTVAHWVKTVLVRKAGTEYPQNVDDGEILTYTESGTDHGKNHFKNTAFTDITATGGEDYRYKLFSVTDNDVWNNLDNNAYPNLDTMSGDEIAGMELEACTQLSTILDDTSVSLSWKDPDDIVLYGATLAVWDETVLVRKEGTEYPADVNDGTVVASTSRAEGNKNAYLTEPIRDTGLSADTEYRYKLFSKTAAGTWNNQEKNAYPTANTYSYAMMQNIVRSGRAEELLPVGTVFEVYHGDFVRADGTSLYYRVIGHDIMELEDPSLQHSMLCHPTEALFQAPYDNNEAEYAKTIDETAQEGKTYYAIVNQQYTALAAGTDYQINEAVPTVNGIVTWYEKNKSGRTSGSNNPVESNARQWMNSDKPAGQWFEKQTIWDTVSSTLANRNGFLYNLDPDFLAVCAAAKVKTKFANVDGGGIATTYDKFFFLSNTQVDGTANSGVMEDIHAPFFATAQDRILKLFNTGTNTVWWLRCPGVINAYRVTCVSASCSLTSNYAYYAYGFAPACVIA